MGEEVMLKSLQTRLQLSLNWKLPDVQAGFRKSRGTRDQIVNIRGITEKAKEFQKIIYFCFIKYNKAFGCVDHSKLLEILKEMGISDHLTCLPRNLYADQEETSRTRYGTMDWFKIGKGVQDGYILTPCLFKCLCRVRHAKCWAGWLSDIQMIPTHSRMWKGTKEPLEDGERGEWKSWLKTQHSWHNDHGIQSHHFMQTDGGEWKQ